MIDPSGYFSLGQAMTTVNIMANLATTAQSTVDVFSSVANGESVSAKDVGFALIVSRMSGGAKLLKNLAKKICKKFNCKVPILDVNHIFYGEIKNRTAKGFHSTALSSSIAGPGVAHVEEVLWKNFNGVYKAWVNIPDIKTGRFRRKKSTMFPDSWREPYVAASLYLTWMKNRGKQKGTLNLGVIKIQYFV